MSSTNRFHKAGRLGGLARVRLHGNPGTPEGRKLGGSRSLKTHAYLGTHFKLLRIVRAPRQSSEFAELLGILAGDGHVDAYQATVTTNSITDREHAAYTQKLFESVFSIHASLNFRKNCNACVVVVSSKEVCRHLVNAGMVRGNKIGGSLSMPAWIRTQESFQRAFMRGLFDTDGCVYIDTHRIRGREYKNIGMAFTSRCPPLLNDYKSTLQQFGLHPTQKSKYVVFLRRESEIRRYFELVGSSNPKHVNKVQQYFLAKGGVPKWS